ncbi:hypothetical protein FALBO_14846 [Fusarium albosuccineum]|uniref:Uncharacterized protein n=1 Tax=Fusarium albosuccineum TaxID=1237068 RepID=A0A8H4KYK7_9HYPO|nr:hypothetical protein FALBO_14846 [Fusarium albosuccineum]
MHQRDSVSSLSTGFESQDIPINNMYDGGATCRNHRRDSWAPSDQQRQTGEQLSEEQPTPHNEPARIPTNITPTSTPSVSGKFTTKIGWWLLLVIITSFLVLLVAIAFLSWLWFASRESDAWRRIMLDGRSTQIITLVGLLIRVAVGSLAAISTSMIASIAFESHGVPVYTMAEVSITRFTNNGPLSLFSLLLFTSTFRIHLRMLAIGLLLFVFASQFTSTMLVSDLGESRIASFNQQTNYGYNYVERMYFYGGSDLDYGADYWSQRPSASEVFAEYSQPVDAPDGVDDTGPTIRAFLPVPLQSEREILRSFNGMARVFDARVVCVRPKVTLHYCNETKSSQETALYLCGSNGCQYVLHCPVPENGSPDDRRQSGLLCSLESAGCIVTASNRTRPHMSFGHGNQWLLSNLGPSTPPMNPQGDSGRTRTENATWTPLSSTTSGPWLKQWFQITSPDGLGKVYIYLQMSLCFDALSPWSYPDVSDILNITAYGPSNHTEPLSTFNHGQNIYDTLTVRGQLGAVTPAEMKAGPKRQILTISPEDIEASLNEPYEKDLQNPHIDSHTGDVRAYINWLTHLIYTNRRAFMLCFACFPGPDLKQVEQVKTQIFMDVINKTSSPALALQALNTMGLRQAYHDQIATFPRAKDATTITRWELAQSPQLFRGFAAVMIIIAVNVSIFGFVCVWFLKVTESSLIGNAWQTIAQVAKSPETQQVLDHAMLAKDKDVENLVRGCTPTKGFSQSIKNSLHWVSRIFKKEKSGSVERLPLRNQMSEETE